MGPQDGGRTSWYAAADIVADAELGRIDIAFLTLIAQSAWDNCL